MKHEQEGKTMWRYINIPIILFAWATLAQADMTWTGKDQLFSERVEMGIRQLYPSVYTEFKDNFKYRYDYDDAVQALKLIDNIKGSKEIFEHLEDMSYYVVCSVRSYRIAWEVALHVWKNSSDEKARKLIQEAWEEGLRKEDSYTCYQICAMAAEWDEIYLTEEFWKIAAHSQKRGVVEGVCYVFYYHDDKEEFDKLVTMRNRLDNTEYW
ncbi:MAG: hypothetical protein PF495_19290 [Spirochaetales bacterium]|jgi:hypothetical protein|nr:hypothetical protein [Spirochaetales bacterium]